jgi:VanZ family protein
VADLPLQLGKSRPRIFDNDFSRRPAHNHNMKRFAAAFALLVLLLLVPIPHVGKVMDSIGDMLHAPLFAVLAFASFHLLRKHLSSSAVYPAAICLVVVSIFAALTEWMQLLTGRTPSGQDLFADICGVTMGVLAAVAVATPRRGIRVAFSLAAVSLFAIAIRAPVAVLVDVARQRSEMPVLGSFERAGEVLRWAAKESSVSRDPDHATSGSWSLRVDLRPGIYPGTSLPLLPPDWSGFDSLVAEVWLAGAESLRIVVKVTDRAHNNEHEDRFQRAVVLSPGANTIRIPLAEIAAAPSTRQLDMQRVATLSFFTVRLKIPRTLYLDNVRLQ